MGAPGPVWLVLPSGELAYSVLGESLIELSVPPCALRPLVSVRDVHHLGPLGGMGRIEQSMCGLSPSVDACSHRQ